MNLPQEFQIRMQKLLGGEYPAFLAGYDTEAHRALRVNTLKLSAAAFTEMAPFSLEMVPWAPNGFYYNNEERPGRHPWHEAGLYYIQEPSAMAVAAASPARPGERVLDLCAAPGGKTTQLASAMAGEGLLISNEIHPARARILSSNVERMGIRNAIVTNETPERLADRFPAFFDRIVVDAPCSGEGMFRREEEALRQWSPENVELCAGRQDEILKQADRMLRPGGILLYSTCTFAPEEDEGSVGRFLMTHPDYEVISAENGTFFAPGHPEWAEALPESGWENGEEKAPAPRQEEKTISALTDTRRLWPHRLRGEGHFVAVLRKTENRESEQTEQAEQTGLTGRTRRTERIRRTEQDGRTERERQTAQNRKMRKTENTGNAEPGKKKGRKAAYGTEHTAAGDAQLRRGWEEFASENLCRVPEGELLQFGEQLYLLPGALDLKGLKVLRPGLHLGSGKKNRFEPAHALALALPAEDFRRTAAYRAEDQTIADYLHGLSLEREGEAGWTVVTVDGYPLGWAKQTGGTLKNHYPKGLRK